MAFNWEAQDTEWFVDQIHEMMLTQNPGWDPDGDNGKGDAIGRTFVAYFTYGDSRFLQAIENCWEKVERKGWLKRFLFGKYYYQGYRYPVRFKDEVGLSRDHLTYTLIAFKYAGYSDEFLQDFVKHLRWRISPFATFVPDLWLWARAMANIKPYTTLYYPVQMIAMKASRWVNKSLYKFMGFGPESHQDDFIKVQNSFKSGRCQKMIKLFYPIFALHITSWQVKLMPDSKRKRKLQKVMRDICPEHNYVIQLLLDDPEKPTQEQVDGYKSMTGGRWTGVLNTFVNDRDINFIKDPKRLEFNVQDEDYLKRLYYSIKCVDI